jgi:hypothetical protein
VSRARALEAVDEILSRGDDTDDLLRTVVDTLVAEGTCRWAGLYFVEGGELVLGPRAGSPEPETPTRTPVVYEGTRVADLVTGGCDDRDFLGRVAELISVHCLVGWDTGGVPWDEEAE